jgi:hypothetical protein
MKVMFNCAVYDGTGLRYFYPGSVHDLDQPTVARFKEIGIFGTKDRPAKAEIIDEPRAVKAKE